MRVELNLLRGEMRTTNTIDMKKQPVTTIKFFFRLKIYKSKIIEKKNVYE